MGRLIDIDKARKEYSNLTDLTMNDTTLLLTLFGVLDNAPTVEAIPKADYENRLKADIVAMLTELSMKIGEIEDGYTEFDEENKRSLTMIPLESIERLIDGEINKLKEAD